MPDKKTFQPDLITLEWWRHLNGLSEAENDTEQSAGNANTGARARLRRAPDPVIALTEAEAINLATRLNIGPRSPERLACIGALAHVLAHVRKHQDRDEKGNKLSMARMLGPDRNDENAIMSALRFQRLMAAKTPDDLMRQMRSAVKLLGGTANIRDLGQAFYWWSHPERGDATRISWTYDYWGASFAKPEQDNI